MTIREIAFGKEIREEIEKACFVHPSMSSRDMAIAENLLHLPVRQRVSFLLVVQRHNRVNLMVILI